MSRTIHVDLGSRSYDIIIKENSLADISEYVWSLGLGKRGIIITNDVVSRWYLDPVARSLEQAGFVMEQFILPDGEQTKCLDWLDKVYHAMLKARLDRNSFVVALGGGVVGDLAGFAAATYMRGIPFIQVPTTLLAQVDSSVGGKTGVNLKEGKNLVGAFYQPKCVVIDPLVLRTLEKRELRAGFAEVIKYGVIRDEVFFRYLEDNITDIFNLKPDCIEHIISVSCRIKAEVVAKDECEAGLRAILNFGHTAGHALEAICGYGKLVHGEGVGIGMAVACSLGQMCTGFASESTDRIKQLIRESGLPYRVPAGIASDLIIEYMRRDKKTANDTIRFVLPVKIGDVTMVDTVSDKDIATAIEANKDT